MGPGELLLKKSLDILFMAITNPHYDLVYINWGLMIHFSSGCIFFIVI